MQSIPVLIKHRFPKTYRHSNLDVLLTRQRLTAEARALVRAARCGVNVPGLRIVDHREGILGIEWIEGWSVREVLGGGQDDVPDVLEEDEDDDNEVDVVEGDDTEVRDRLRQMGVEDGERSFRTPPPGLSTDHCLEDALLESIGGEIAKMHLADVIHGDLTTSNMMVRLKKNLSIQPIFDLVSVIPSSNRAIALWLTGITRRILDPDRFWIIVDIASTRGSSSRLVRIGACIRVDASDPTVAVGYRGGASL